MKIANGIRSLETSDSGGIVFIFPGKRCSLILRVWNLLAINLVNTGFEDQAGALDACRFQRDAERVQQFLRAAGGAVPGRQAHADLHGLSLIISRGCWGEA